MTKNYGSRNEQFGILIIKFITQQFKIEFIDRDVQDICVYTYNQKKRKEVIS